MVPYVVVRGCDVVHGCGWTTAHRSASGALSGSGADEVFGEVGARGEVDVEIAGDQSRGRETGVAASQVVESAGELSRNGEDLKTQVDAFLREVRAA